MNIRSRSAFFAALLALGVTSTAAAAQQAGYVAMSDSGRIYYKIAGTGPDTVIAIHGGPGMDLESIAGDFTELTKHHVVIFYDQRGGGKSSLPADTMQLVYTRQVQDLDELRRHFHLTRVALLAHSYGPLLAASYALAHPEAVKRMVFFGPVPPRQGNFWSRYSQNLNSRLDSAQRAQMSAASRRMTNANSPDSVARQACREYWALGVRPRLAEPDRTGPLLKSDFCVTDMTGIRYGNRTGNRVIMASYGAWDLRDQLKSLQVPLLVVHGEQETIPMDLIEEWVSSMPHATLLRVPNAAHFTYMEQPQLVWPAVEKFLADGRPKS